MPNILIIVENLPVPLDRRVWQEATALARAGYGVSVICPKQGKYTESHEVRDGVQIFRHAMPPEGVNVFGYLREYIWAFLAEFWLTCKVYRRVGFDVIQACNPPDNIFIIGCFFRMFFGTKFVFDHHDPFADLFALKFPTRACIGSVTRFFERCSLRSADHVVTTSEELRQLAMNRCGVPADRISLVRSGFNFSKIGDVKADPALKRGKTFLALYIGVMGSQDGIDVLLHAIDDLVHHKNRTDIHFALAGGGTELQAMKELSRQLRLEEYVEFTGYLEGNALYSLLATADIGLCPDPKNDFNDKLSMNKLLEYMAFGLPTAQFDLNEARRIAGDAAVYATSNEPAALGQVIVSLLDDPKQRAERGAVGRQRLRDEFEWDKQEKIYLGVYAGLLSSAGK